jgi:hypothetical protein
MIGKSNGSTVSRQSRGRLFGLATRKPCPAGLTTINCSAKRAPRHDNSKARYSLVLIGGILSPE